MAGTLLRCTLRGESTFAIASISTNHHGWINSRFSDVGIDLTETPHKGSLCEFTQKEIGNLLPNNRRQRRTCYALCHILYPVSAAHTSIFRMDSNSTSYTQRPLVPMSPNLGANINF